MNRKLLSLFLFSLISLLSSCSKENGPGVPDDCKIIKVATGNTMYSLIYNSDGKISSIREVVPNDFELSYVYTTDGYVATKKENNTIAYKATAIYNAQGFVESCTTLDYTGQWDTKLESFEYDAAGYLIRQTSKLDNDPEVVITSTWSNGNLINNSAGYSFEYYTDMPYQSGDLLGVLNLINGVVTGKPSKNLMKAMHIGGNSTAISYVINQEGNIAVIQWANGFINLDHLCD